MSAERPWLTFALGGVGIVAALLVSAGSGLVGMCGAPSCGEDFARGMIPWIAFAALAPVLASISLWRTGRKDLRAGALAIAGAWSLAAWPALGLVLTLGFHLDDWLLAIPLALGPALLAAAMVLWAWTPRSNAT